MMVHTLTGVLLLIILLSIGANGECPDFRGLSHGEAIQAQGTASAGELILEITCHEGFVLKGKRRVICQKDGKWSTRGYCKRLGCSMLPGLNSSGIENVSIIRPFGFKGTKYIIECRSDIPTTTLNVNVDNSAICFPNNTWSNKDFGCMRDCTVTYDVNSVIISDVNESGVLSHGKALNWTCKEGYKRESGNGAADVTCYDGHIEAPVCVKEVEDKVAGKVSPTTRARTTDSPTCKPCRDHDSQESVANALHEIQSTQNTIKLFCLINFSLILINLIILIMGVCVLYTCKKNYESSKKGMFRQKTESDESIEDATKMDKQKKKRRRRRKSNSSSRSSDSS